MTVNLQFSAPFNGVVFSKGHFSNPACRYVKTNSGRQSIRLTVPLSSCGTQTVESSSDRLMIENTIVIQADPMVQDTWDSARKITCDWQSKLEKMVTFAPFSVADMMQVAEVKFAGSGDNVRTRMEIQFGRGPFAPPLEGLTKIGDELTVVVYAEDGGAGYDIMVKNCFAYDSRNFQRANKIQLLNNHGCLFRPHQMEYFRRTFDTRSTGADIIAFARMNAFKFPDKMDVFLSCELEMCKGGCDTHCEMDDYPIDIIENLGHIRQPDQTQDTIAVTTFRPQLRPQARTEKTAKQLMRRRKPKKFGNKRMKDDARRILSPPSTPVTLSPEILELLEELGAQTEAQERSSEASPFTEGNHNTVMATSNFSTGRDIHHSPLTMANEGQQLSHNSALTPISKMSFSTIFAGTHTTGDSIPPNIASNDARFKPSQLLNAAMAQDSGPFPADIQAKSQGSSGSSSAAIPLPRTAALTAPQLGHANTLTNGLKQELSLPDPFFKPAELRSDQNVGQGGQLSTKFGGHLATGGATSPTGSTSTVVDNNNKVATLQQQLITEGQFVCGPESLDVKCNPKSNEINVGGFRPISTTPNAIVSSTVVFTSPKSVEKFAKHSQPKEALIKILDSPRPISQLQPPKRADIKPARARFGSRLANNAKRFASFFGARRRRDADPDDWDDYGNDMFGPSETVNMVRGFQVVSASDLAFDPKSMQTRLSDIKDGPEEEICFPETSFYAALLVACSLLMISGIVSVCSIRTVRRLRNKRIKQRYFGGDTSLESY